VVFPTKDLVSTTVLFTPSINPLDYFQTDNSSFQTNDTTPNIQLQLSGSVRIFNVDPTTTINFDLEIHKNGDIIKSDNYNILPSTITNYTISTLINPTVSDFYQIKVQNNNASKANSFIFIGNYSLNFSAKCFQCRRKKY
jgi:hypothetical protein